MSLRIQDLQHASKSLRPEPHISKIKILKDFIGWPFSKLELLAVLVFLIAGLCHCIIFSSYLSLDIVKQNHSRTITCQALSALTMIFGVYACIIFKVNQGLWVNLTLFISLVFIPVFILVIILGERSFIPVLGLSVTCIFIPAAAIGLAIFKIIRKAAIELIGTQKGEILMILLNVLCNLLFNLVASVILAKGGLGDTEEDAKYFAFLYLSILILLWVVLHFEVYKKYPDEIECLKKEILEFHECDIQVQVILSENPEILKSVPEGFLSKYGHLLASLGILISMLSIEIGLISHISEYSQGAYPDSSLYLSLFYVFAVPVFVFFGILFSSSNLVLRDKYLIVLVILSFIPTIFIMWLSYYLYTIDSTKYVGVMIGLGIPGSFIYWISVSMINSHNKRTFQYFSSILCLVLVIPIGLILPLYYAGGMSTGTFGAVEGVLLFAGMFLLGLWLFQIFVKVSKELFLLYKQFSPFQVQELVLYVYSLCFIIGYALISWMMFKKIDMQSDWISGLLAGCYVLLGLLMVNTLILHKIELYTEDLDSAQEAISDIVLGSKKTKNENELKNQAKKKKIQLIIIAAGTILSFVISIPILASGQSDSSNSTGTTIIVGGLSATFTFILLIELKHFLKRFGDTVISYTIGYCWLFCFIPIVVLIPVSLSSTNSNSDERSVASWSIGSVLLLFMIGVSIVCIAINQLFEKLKYEKLAKYCSLEVQEMLTDIGVKVKLVDLRGIYDNFYHSNAEVVEQVLIDQTVYTFRQVKDDEPDLQYSKEILTLKELNKMKLKELNDIKKTKKKGMSVFKCLRKMCMKSKDPVFVRMKTELKSENLDIQISEKDPLKENNWAKKFKKDVKIVKKKRKARKKNAKLKAESGFSTEDHVNVQNIKAAKLSKATKKKIMQSKELESLLKSFEGKETWLKSVFARFSSGMIADDGEAWMNLTDLRNFIRLAGLSKRINNATCDVLYYTLTRIYNPEDGTISFKKINFEVFSDLLLDEIAKLLKYKLDKSDAQNQLIQNYFYPYIATKLPKLKIIPGKRNFGIILFAPGEESEINGPETGLRGETSAEELNKRIIFSKYLDKVSSCFSSVFKKIIQGFRKVLDKGLDLFKPVDLPEKPEKAQVVKELTERQKSPEWEEICRLTVEKFVETHEAVTKGQVKHSVYMSMNMANISAIISHISEVYSFSSLAFSSQVGWTYGNNFTRTSSVVLADDKYWVPVYWACFSVSVIFIVLLYPTFKLLKKGRFGLNSDFTPVSFPSPHFFLSNFISVVAVSMYLTIMCALLGSFSCIYTGDSWHLVRESSIICFSNEHIPYFIISIILLIFYYPAATLLYPNLAYQDKALDIKFDTSYLVLESQGKVLIAGISVFFPKEDYIGLQLIVSIIVSLSLFFACLKMKPCLITSYNIWKTGGFLIPMWVCLCALINYYTFNTVLAIVLLVLGVTAIVGILFWLQSKYYGFKRRKAEKKEFGKSLFVLNKKMKKNKDDDPSIVCS